MLKYICWSILLITFLMNCSQAKNTFVSSGNQVDDAIRIALNDFPSNHRLYNRDSVFMVAVYFIENNNDYLVVKIGKFNGKLLMSKDVKVGSFGKLPTKSFFRDGKLFFWWDDNSPLTDAMLASLKKYNLLQDDNNGFRKLPDYIIDDAQKSAHYYFCKTNINSYKKVVTNIGVGYYDPPNLRCRNVVN